MEIVGLGVDITDIPRVAEVFARYGERFLRRVFTEGAPYATSAGTSSMKSLVTEAEVGIT